MPALNCSDSRTNTHNSRMQNRANRPPGPHRRDFIAGWSLAGRVGGQLPALHAIGQCIEAVGQREQPGAAFGKSSLICQGPQHRGLVAVFRYPRYLRCIRHGLNSPIAGPAQRRAPGFLRLSPADPPPAGHPGPCEPPATARSHTQHRAPQHAACSPPPGSRRSRARRPRRQQTPHRCSALARAISYISNDLRPPPIPRGATKPGRSKARGTTEPGEPALPARFWRRSVYFALAVRALSFFRSSTHSRLIASQQADREPQRQPARACSFWTPRRRPSVRARSIGFHSRSMRMRRLSASRCSPMQRSRTSEP